MGGALQIILTTVILVSVYVRGKSYMRGPLIEIYGFYLVAIIGYIIFKVVTTLIIFIILTYNLILFTLSHESSLSLIVKSRCGLNEYNVASLAAASVVVRV